MLPPEPAPERLALTSSSASDGSCSGSDPCAGSYICTTKIVRGIPVMTSILRPLVGASSSSASASSSDPDSSDDYPKIEAGACGETVEDGCLICMVPPNGDRSHNSSNRYPTIGRIEASDARTPSGGLVRNLNPDFNVVRVPESLLVSSSTSGLAMVGSREGPSAMECRMGVVQQVAGKMRRREREAMGRDVLSDASFIGATGDRLMIRFPRKGAFLFQQPRAIQTRNQGAKR
jgi:hypothetical protein